MSNNSGRGTVSVLLAAARPITVGVTQFPIQVNIANSQSITNLTVELALTHPSDQNLSIQLQSPNGGPSITLVFAGALTGTNIGILGASTTFQGFTIGTTFDDNATRNIFDPNANGTNANTNPYIGHFQPEGSTLDGFLRLVQQTNGTLNGTWQLVISDSTTNPNPPGFLRSLSLQFNSNMQPQGQGTVADEFFDVNLNETLTA